MNGQSVTWERFHQKGSPRLNRRRWQSRTRGSIDRHGLYVNVEQPVAACHDWIIDGRYGMAQYRGSAALSVDAGVAYAGRWQLADSRTNFYVRTEISFF